MALVSALVDRGDQVVLSAEDGSVGEAERDFHWQEG